MGWMCRTPHVLRVRLRCNGRRTGTSQHDYIVAILTACFESGIRWVVTSIDNVVTVHYQIDVGWYIPIGERL
jgi:hypothetical protein